MALIDITELFVDPDFVDGMQLITRKPFVNTFGENILIEAIAETVGSIQPATGEAISKMPEAFRVENLQSFWLNGNIPVSEPGKYSSILVFKGRRYQVKTVFDWTNWGGGWSEGLCVAEVPAP